MNIDVINECTSLSLKGEITFPEVVQRLANTGVERYRVDFIELTKTTYGKNGEIHKCVFDWKTYQIPEKFTPEVIKNAIEDIQQQRINYQTFLDRIIKGGCSHYEVFITGKRVIYFGRDGNYHVELFPSSKP